MSEQSLAEQELATLLVESLNLDGVAPARLAELGELHKPSVADLFVATMKGTYA